MKLNNTFEKIGFASDTYLGFLTVSPEHLGTALTFSSTIAVPSVAFYDCKDTIRDKLLSLQATSGISYSAEDRGVEMMLTIASEQSLAPNYNEQTQMEGFLSAVIIVGETLAASGFRGGAHRDDSVNQVQASEDVSKTEEE